MSGRGAQSRARLRVLAAYAVMLGCAGTETGNPSFEGELAYDAFSSDVRAVALRQDTGAAMDDALVIDAAWLVLGDVRLLAGQACLPSGDTVHATGIGEGDHAQEGRVVTAFSAQAGEHCGALVPLERAPQVPAQGPDALGGHSVLIDGTLPDGRRFRVRSALQQALMLKTSTPFVLSSELRSVLIGFDLAMWLGAVPLSDAAVEADGSILVDAEHNPDLLAMIESALSRGTALYRGDVNSAITRDVELARGE